MSKLPAEPPAPEGSPEHENDGGEESDEYDIEASVSSTPKALPLTSNDRKRKTKRPVGLRTMWKTKLRKRVKTRAKCV